MALKTHTPIPGFLSVAIQAHQSRAGFIPYLHRELGPAPVAWSREPSTGRRDVWATHRRAKLMHDPAARFHLVVQDDALIGRDFYARLQRVLEERGDGFVYCLFYRPKTKTHFHEFNVAGRTGLQVGGFAYRKLQFAVATVTPTALIPALVRGCDRIVINKPGGQDDTRMSWWLRRQGIKTFYPLPSLVDHRHEGIGTSGRPNAGRRAWRFE